MRADVVARIQATMRNAVLSSCRDTGMRVESAEHTEWQAAALIVRIYGGVLESIGGRPTAVRLASRTDRHTTQARTASS